MEKTYLVIDNHGDEPEVMNRSQIEEMILNYHFDMGFDTTKKQLKRLSMKQLDNVVGGFGKSIQEII